MLHIKIHMDGLTLRNYTETLHKADKEFITQSANRNNLSWYPCEDGVSLRFTGKHGDLFTFLYDVAFRYDIELV